MLGGGGVDACAGGEADGSEDAAWAGRGWIPVDAGAGAGWAAAAAAAAFLSSERRASALKTFEHRPQRT